MAQKNRTTLKGYFNTGDKPTEAQFADLIDSFLNLLEDPDVAMDADDIRDALETLTGINRLDKDAVFGAEDALNWRGTNDVYSVSYQTINMINVKKGDFWMYNGEGTPDPSDPMAAMDVVIAIKDAPSGFTYTDDENWHIVRWSRLRSMPIAKIVEDANYKVMTAAERSKLAGIEAGADVTDAANVSGAGALMKSEYGAYTVVVKQSALSQPDDLAINEGVVLGRLPERDISGLTASELKTLCAYLTDLIDDASPQLGGNLDVNGKKITSASNGDIEIEPNGSGVLKLLKALLTSPDIKDGSGNYKYRLLGGTLATNRTLNLPVMTGDDTLVVLALAQTLTNKRITPRILTEASNTAPTIDTDLYDQYILTALAGNITAWTMSGTPTNGQKLIISITGTGAMAITWGTSSFESSTVTLPTTTVSTNRIDVGFIWNATTGKWRCIAKA